MLKFHLDENGYFYWTVDAQIGGKPGFLRAVPVQILDEPEIEENRDVVVIQEPRRVVEPPVREVFVSARVWARAQSSPTTPAVPRHSSVNLRDIAIETFAVMGLAAAIGYGWINHPAAPEAIFMVGLAAVIAILGVGIAIASTGVIGKLSKLATVLVRR